MLLNLFLCLLVACESNTPMYFSDTLPDHWQHVSTDCFDTNNDGDQEWVVLYRFDQAVGTEANSGPVRAIVYQSDDIQPPNFLAYELLTPDSDYLCECKCTPTMEDVLSGLEGSELVIRDTCNKKTTALTIFHWDLAGNRYWPAGHFHGHQVEVALDEVRREERDLSSRAQLATCATYYPRDNWTYYQYDDQNVLVTPTKQELVFCSGEPEDVTLSPYPEKIVLAFYNHYTDTAKASGYFAEGAWEGLGQCDASLCGCAGPRSEITHVRVTGLQLEWEAINKDRSLGPDQATVGATVVCEHPGGMSDGETPVQWYLIRMGDRWQISSRE